MFQTLQSTQTYSDGNGQPIVLGASIGRGGEGEVFAVNGRFDLVAKIYHQPLTAGRAEKITAMAALDSPDLAAVCAWPIGFRSTNGTDSSGYRWSSRRALDLRLT